MPDIAYDETEKEIKKLEKKLAKEYAIAEKELKAKLEDYLQRYEIKNQIKLEQLQNGEITQEYYEYWRTGQIMIGKRWEEMVQTISEDLTNANQIAMQMVNNSELDAFALNHNYSTFELEKGSLLNTSYTLYDRQTVKNIIKKNPNLLPKPTVDIPKDLKWNKQKINSSILQGIIQGESIPQIAKRLENLVGMNYRSAVRNARTAMTGAQNSGRLEAGKRAKAMGIDSEMVWIATLDGRTRHSHRLLDGERIEVTKVKTKKFSNGCRYPGDPKGPPAEVYNCRCKIVYDIEGFATDYSDLSIRNTKHFEYASYDDWKNNRPSSSVSNPTPEQEAQIKSGVPKVNETIKITIDKSQIPANKSTEIENKQKSKILSMPENSFLTKYMKNNQGLNYMVDSEKKSLGKLSTDERQAIIRYTGSAYTEINGYFRGIYSGQYTKSESENYYGRSITECAQTLVEAFNNPSMSTKEEYYLRRGTDFGDLAGLFYSGDFNQNKNRLYSLSVEELKKEIVGEVGVYAGCTSTSSQRERGFGGDVEVIIKAPVGTKGSSVMSISQFGTGEGEFLLAPGTSVVCHDVQKVDWQDSVHGEKIRVFLEILTK